MSKQPMTREATVNDLYTFGYARTFPGHWLRPNGLSVVREPDALHEVAELLNPTQTAQGDGRQESA